MIDSSNSSNFKRKTTNESSFPFYNLDLVIKIQRKLIDEFVEGFVDYLHTQNTNLISDTRCSSLLQRLDFLSEVLLSLNDLDSSNADQDFTQKIEILKDVESSLKSEFLQIIRFERNTEKAEYFKAKIEQITHLTEALRLLKYLKLN